MCSEKLGHPSTDLRGIGRHASFVEPTTNAESKINGNTTVSLATAAVAIEGDLASCARRKICRHGYTDTQRRPRRPFFSREFSFARVCVCTCVCVAQRAVRQVRPFLPSTRLHATNPGKQCMYYLPSFPERRWCVSSRTYVCASVVFVRVFLKPCIVFPRVQRRPARAVTLKRLLCCSHAISLALRRRVSALLLSADMICLTPPSWAHFHPSC